LEQVVPENCIIASNTSAIPITKIAQGSKRPQNVIGMHYFSPVDKMPLLEVVTTELASNEAKAAAVDVGIRQGKTVIVVRDGPGFYTTRILSPFMVEAGALLQEGHDIKELDKQLRNFGFPVGPVTLFDEVGIDVGNHIQPTLIAAFGERMGGAKTEMMEEMVKSGLCGRKTKAGFFLYDGKKKEVNPKAVEIIQKYQSESCFFLVVYQQRLI
jgi:3-hydroxyacyl-CoA dehydrogenase